MSRLKELLHEAHLHRCWGEEPPPELLDEIEAEKRRNRPSKELVRTLKLLRRTWAEAAASQKKLRNIIFLGAVYREVLDWREACRLKRREDLETSLAKFYEVDPGKQDLFQMLLLIVCGDQIDRKVRSRWTACLRTLDRRKTPADLGAAQILRLGGISRCACR